MSHDSMIGRNSVPSSNYVYQSTEIAMPPLPKDVQYLERMWVLRNASDLLECLCMQPTIPFWLAVLFKCLCKQATNNPVPACSSKDVA